MTKVEKKIDRPKKALLVEAQVEENTSINHYSKALLSAANLLRHVGSVTALSNIISMVHDIGPRDLALRMAELIGELDLDLQVTSVPSGLNRDAGT